MFLPACLLCACDGPAEHDAGVTERWPVNLLIDSFRDIERYYCNDFITCVF